MASRGAIAGIQADALKRVEAATAEIVAHLGITEPPAAPHARQSDLREAYELERQAALLEQIAAGMAALVAERNALVAQMDGAGAGEESPDDAEPGDPAEDAVGDADAAPVDGAEADAAGDPPLAERGYDDLPYSDLKELAEARGLEPGRSKVSAIEALREADTSAAADERPF